MKGLLEATELCIEGQRTFVMADGTLIETEELTEEQIAFYGQPIAIVGKTLEGNIYEN